MHVHVPMCNSLSKYMYIVNLLLVNYASLLYIVWRIMHICAYTTRSIYMSQM